MNEILVRKAIKYLQKGVVGIDIAGSESKAFELGPDIDGWGDLYARARTPGWVQRFTRGRPKRPGRRGSVG